ncbi:LysR substrate-binding domain-containing protein [Agrobacterium tumefaciens]|uniref:LysR substrate-binding domain-containing protein n=1 Tax=Agrobacterium tumefaciens TaxID=358 RepID=UPI001573FD16|nr:LysR substrate-binding domain-containing protein [Agrobacterium tumefaciens]NTA19078.1 LysR family transcriptional regulator [Agrobacterium tumefaciens]WCK74368.1 LysR substrate-binding domain-containing protein [Agrobacterium tumefaciens]
MSYANLPLHALRAFEATIRLGSMTKAAKELDVSHGAISRHIRELERLYATTLVRRLSKSSEPTPAGAEMALTLSEGFRSLNLAVARLSTGPLTLSCSATIMQYWLIPKLPEFKALNPHIHFRLNVNYSEVDFARDGISVAIRNTMYSPPGDVVILDMIGEEIGPVCSAEYLSRNPLKHPAELKEAQILGTATRKGAWEEWFQAAGEEVPELKIAEEYEHFYLMLQAATFGAGLAIAPKYLIQREINAGQLVAPFGFILGPHRLQLWIAHHLRQNLDVKTLAGWIEAKMVEVG